ncbi:MAG TPA: helix-turn-helix domain-containing protein [Solirubrobacterales bacterium]|nr:helix-turn-helix domain-containing protein [Solirubrobacterales bacterium]
MQYLSQRLAAELARAPEEDRPLGLLAADQRERLLAATEKLIAERGAPATTIEAIVKEAGVSSVTFYEHFRNKEECFVAAFDRAVEGLRAALAEAVPAEGTWASRAQTGIAALLAALDAEPARARLVFVEAQKGGPRLRARYDEALGAAAGELADPLGEAIAGGLAWLLRERLELGGGEDVRDLLPRMTEVVLGPYLGDGEPASGASGDG